MKKLMLALSALASVSAFADDMVLGQPGYGGSGCPQGTASAVLAPDQKSMSILFDRYVTEAGPSVGVPIARKSCMISIPVHVPQGYILGIFSLDYRGANALPASATAQFNVEYFFAGGRGPRYTKTFLGTRREDNGEFLIHNELLAEGIVWTGCGADVILRTNSSMTVRSPREYASTSIDSVDVDSGLIYHFQWMTCDGTPVDAPTPF